MAANTRCRNPFGCGSANLIAHYQHIAPGTNHQWDVQPAIGPDADSAPFDQECPLDLVATHIKYPPVYVRCPRCGYKTTY